MAAAALAIPSAFAQGTFTLGGSVTTNCPAVCNSFKVEAPGIPSTQGGGAGVISVRRAATGAAGALVFHSGSAGGGWWNSNPTLVDPYFDKWIAEDYDIFQIKWSNGGWIDAPSNSQLGMAVLAQRPATAFNWIATNQEPNYMVRGPVILVGSSNGSGAVAYALAYYGASSYVSKAIIVSGPPQMKIREGCIVQAGQEEFAYSTPSSKGFIDGTYNSPCCTQGNVNFASAFTNASVESGYDYNYPRTKVRILLGLSDKIMIRARGQAYYDLLMAHNQPNVTIKYVFGAGHSFQQSGPGMGEIDGAIHS